MTIDPKETPLWSSQQQQALAALNLPMWQRKPSVVKTAEEGAAAQTEQANCYKAGQWLVVTSEPLAVELPLWLSDLVSVCSGSSDRPAEVSPSAVSKWAQPLVLKLAKDQPSAADKKALWKHIAQQQQ